MIPNAAPASVSCLRALQSCQESHGCASAYETMKALCPMDGTNCKSGVASPLCLSLWEELRRGPLGQCTCNQGRRKCLPIWRFIHENPCVHKGLEGQVLYMTTSDQNSQWRIRKMLCLNSVVVVLYMPLLYTTEVIGEQFEYMYIYTFIRVLC